MASESPVVWVARDPGGALGLGSTRPHLIWDKDNCEEVWGVPVGDSIIELNTEWFPDIKPGEKRAFRLVPLEEEKA